MKKIVLKLDLHDDKDKQRALKAVSRLPGIDSIAMDMKEMKLSVVGVVDPVDVVNKLRRCWRTEIFSVGPATKEPEKKDQQPKTGGGGGTGGGGAGGGPAKKDEGGGEKKNNPPPTSEQQHITELVRAYQAYNPHMTTHYYVQSAEENPNACVIC